jgi:hypothetical protein
MNETPDPGVPLTAETVVVPVEPTEAMWSAGERAFDRDPDLHHETVLANIWSAMLSAAPAREPEGGAVELTRFRAMVEEKLQVATRADHADALFPMGPEEAAFYHRTRADLLGWVLDMLPSDTPTLTPKEAPAREAEGNQVGVGLVIAAGIAVASGAEGAAREILGAAGLTTEAAMRDAGVDAYDISLLADIIKEMAEKANV